MQLLKSFVCLCLLTSALWAQEFRATISGRVSDASGAAVVGAKVVVTNLETSAANRTVSSDSGDYVIPALSPGRYKLEVEASGFKKSVRDNLTLEVLARPTIDVALEAGAVITTLSLPNFFFRSSMVDSTN